MYNVHPARPFNSLVHATLFSTLPRIISASTLFHASIATYRILCCPLHGHAVKSLGGLHLLVLLVNGVHFVDEHVVDVLRQSDDRVASALITRLAGALVDVCSD